MNDVPGWVGPTMAVSLLVIALSFLAIGGAVVYLTLAMKKQLRRAGVQVAKIKADVESATARARKELEGYADISADARGRLRGAIDAVDTRLRDLDALVEVLQSEAEETALDAAAFMRTIRRTGSVLGVAKAALKGRRRGRR